MVLSKNYWDLVILSTKSRLLNRWTLQVYDEEVKSEYYLQRQQHLLEMILPLTVLSVLILSLLAISAFVTKDGWAEFFWLAPLATMCVVQLALTYVRRTWLLNRFPTLLYSYLVVVTLVNMYCGEAFGTYKLQLRATTTIEQSMIVHSIINQTSFIETLITFFLMYPPSIILVSLQNEFDPVSG